MNLLALTVFIYAVLVIITTGFECTWKKFINNQTSFGPECMYICHCMDDIQCDRETGECPNGCAAGWTGPLCQYGDVAYKKGVTQKTTRPVSNSGVKGSVDGDINTCSQTIWGNDQWWRADLGAIYSISGLIINSSEAYALKGFEVKIGNGSDFPGICFRHNDEDVIDTVTNVMCTSKQIGRHVMIWLPGKSSRITLCDVRAYSVCTTNEDYECTGLCGQCEEGSLCDATTRICLQGCQPSWWGLSCTYRCGYCKENTKCSRLEGYCFQCSTGKWGYFCNKTCTGCLTGTGCDIINGTCLKGCLPCCFGLNCDKTCRNCAGDASCDRITGTCLHGCLPGWTEVNKTCNTVCPAGTYGQNCSQDCGFCINDTACERIDGTCRMGCASGYTGDVCSTSCPSGRFGQNCSQVCGNCATDTTCHQTNGTCFNGCSAGYFGTQCITKCLDGAYGQNCSEKCGFCHNGTFCDHINGYCKGGCASGYTGDVCKTKCRHGLYGQNCSEKCGFCFNMTHCNYINGSCNNGCASGYTGDDCKTTAEEQRATEEEESVNIGAAVGGATGAIMLTLIAVIVIVICRQRRPLSKKLDGNSLPTKEAMTKHNGLNTYENISAFNRDKMNNVPELVSDLMCSSQTGECQIECTTATNENERELMLICIEEEGNLRASKEETQLENLDGDVSDKMSDWEFENDADCYYNLDTKRIIVDDLADYLVHGIYSSTAIELEYQALVSGPQSEMTIALKQNNRQKNRYKGIYAYDKTRVVLDPLPDEPDSDYINACFINGYKKDKKYIAAQGPTTTIVNDFWRMIWQYNIPKIVMVTGLYEHGKQKCYQYWPSKGSIKFGTIRVEIVDEDVCAEYTCRLLKFTQTASGEQKMVTQFHFTAWLDRDVPDSPASLLQFLHKVRHTGGHSESPTLVHCSAGIGRTGTYIAIDYLYEEGKAAGSIHVFDCINNLRRQRVGMVQNAEQYVYIHEVLAEAFVRSGKRVDVDDFPDYYQQLNETDQLKKQNKLRLEFDSVQNDRPTTHGKLLSKATKEDEYTCAKLQENIMKNRYHNILPSRRYRPFLSSYVEGRNDYINGVCLPTRKNKNGLLLTQTPLPATVVDFWRLIFEYEVETLVMFQDDNLTDEKIGNYWPTGDNTCLVDPFTVTTVSETRKSTYVERVLQASKQGEERSLKVKQFVCDLWKSQETTPESARLFLNFLEDVENWQRQSEHRPIIVHCLNGAERSGLFCVLWCVFERLKADREVAIRSVVRQMRVRRQQIIPNFAQYQFCHDVILEYLTNFVTYTNI
ncbi:hypothetical protein CHS0354_041959 [Potamilus streckersoni]|uniref:protein-tyrosine-phosphatase n=1 Tax=Potamilus streckersoni TaxID=2493646 RepID=A0AAE0TAJ9_9BIVA|nr:hypothetical protein CHS0354_041959 [Potamilus streckersoni]